MATSGSGIRARARTRAGRRHALEDLGAGSGQLGDGPLVERARISVRGADQRLRRRNAGMSRSSSLAALRSAAATGSTARDGYGHGLLGLGLALGLGLVAGGRALAGQLLHEVAVLEAGLHARVDAGISLQARVGTRRGCCRSRWR